MTRGPKPARVLRAPRPSWSHCVGACVQAAGSHIHQQPDEGLSSRFVGFGWGFQMHQQYPTHFRLQMDTWPHLPTGPQKTGEGPAEAGGWCGGFKDAPGQGEGGQTYLLCPLSPAAGSGDSLSQRILPGDFYGAESKGNLRRRSLPLFY